MAAGSRDFIGYGTDRPTLSWPGGAKQHEICSHGYRWEEVFRLSEDEEREHIRLAVESLERTTGQRPMRCVSRRERGIGSPNAGPDDVVSVFSFPGAELPPTERRDGAR
jgi:peptidoglycan/xylan/chitin deacetylase (PgdA/CDA1 family)